MYKEVQLKVDLDLTNRSANIDFSPGSKVDVVTDLSVSDSFGHELAALLFAGSGDLTTVRLADPVTQLPGSLRERVGIDEAQGQPVIVELQWDHYANAAVINFSQPDPSCHTFPVDNGAETDAVLTFSRLGELVQIELLMANRQVPESLREPEITDPGVYQI